MDTVLLDQAKRIIEDDQWQRAMANAIGHARTLPVAGLGEIEDGSSIVRQIWHPVTGSLEVRPYLIIVRRHIFLHDVDEGSNPWVDMVDAFSWPQYGPWSAENATSVAMIVRDMGVRPFVTSADRSIARLVPT